MSKFTVYLKILYIFIKLWIHLQSFSNKFTRHENKFLYIVFLKWVSNKLIQYLIDSLHILWKYTVNSLNILWNYMNSSLIIYEVYFVYHKRFLQKGIPLLYKMDFDIYIIKGYCKWIHNVFNEPVVYLRTNCSVCKQIYSNSIEYIVIY